MLQSSAAIPGSGARTRMGTTRNNSTRAGTSTPGAGGGRWVSSSGAERTGGGLAFLWVAWLNQKDLGTQQEGVGLGWYCIPRKVTGQFEEADWDVWLPIHHVPNGLSPHWASQFPIRSGFLGKKTQTSYLSLSTKSTLGHCQHHHSNSNSQMPQLQSHQRHQWLPSCSFPFP